MTALRSDNRDIAEIVAGQIDDARDAWDDDTDLALKFYDGEVDFSPRGKHNSKVVSRDVSDIHGLIMPGLMRTFFSSDRVAEYEPTLPEHEAYADSASQALNHIVLRESDGYRHFRAAFSDALLLGNGIVKHYWDATPRYATHSYSGLTADQRAMVLSSDDVEEVESTSYVDDGFEAPPEQEQAAQIAQVQQAAQSGQVAPDQLEAMAAQTLAAIQAPTLFDMKVKRLQSAGRIVLVAIPHHEFLLERGATVLDETTRFCAHHRRRTRSDLIEEGYDREKVDAAPGYSGLTLRPHQTKSTDSETTNSLAPDRSTEFIDVYECYVLHDANDDGIAERRRVVMAGETGKLSMLSDEEWGDELPFSDIVPDPRPHQWRGRSLYDEIGDIQRIKTVLLRAFTDNLYDQSVPQTDVYEGSVLNPDELVNPTPGGVRWLKVGAQPPTPVRKENIAPIIGPGLDYMDTITEKRTGISARSQAMDMDALQNQSATAVNAAMAAAHTKTEEYSRNIAKCGGMMRVFSCLLKLFVAHQDRPKLLKMRGQKEMAEIDPRDWDADMMVTINTGLGTGSRDRDLAMLQGVSQEQKYIISLLGPFNPICGIPQLLDTQRKMSEVAGLSGPEGYFPDLSEERAQQLATQAGQAPNPEAAKAQAKAQADMAEMQQRGQKEQAELALRRYEIDQENERQREKMDRELALEERRVAAHEREIDAKIKLRAAEMITESELAEAEIARGQADAATLNIARPL